MAERIPYLRFDRQGNARIVGVDGSIGSVFCYETNTRHKPGWVWMPTKRCPKHLVVDLGFMDRRKDVCSKLYDLHLPTVRRAQGVTPAPA